MNVRQTLGCAVRAPAVLAPAVLVVALALVAPAATSASSLAFVRPSDGNVWLAAPDGTEQLQVTTNGSPADPYFSPTQSESGAIEVARGAGAAGRIYRLNRLGSRLSAPFGLTQAPVIFDPVVSPDGRNVALWTASVADVTTPCYADFYCFEVSNADHYNQLVRPAWMTLKHPAWLGSSRLLLFNDTGTLSYADLAGHGFNPWLSWADYHPSAADGPGEWLEGAASSDRRQLALVTHLDASGRFVIQLFAGSSDMGEVDLASYRPTQSTCVLSAPDGGGGGDPRHPSIPAFDSLTFSPHGTALAYGFKGSIYIATLASCTSAKVLGGAGDPFWGPRSVTAPKLSVSAARVKTIGDLLRGLRVTVTLNTPGTVVLALTQGTQTLAHALVKLAAHRRRTVALKPSPGVARRLNGIKKLRATLGASVAGFRRPVQTVQLTLTAR